MSADKHDHDKHHHHDKHDHDHDKHDHDHDEHEKKHHPLLEMFNADGMIEHPADPQPEGPNDTPLADPYAS